MPSFWQPRTFLLLIVRSLALNYERSRTFLHSTLQGSILIIGTLRAFMLLTPSYWKHGNSRHFPFSMLEALEQKNLLLASKILHGFLESKSILLCFWNVLWTLRAPMESTSKLAQKQISFLQLILFHSWSSKLRIPMQNSSKIGQKQLSWLLAFFHSWKSNG